MPGHASATMAKRTLTMPRHASEDGLSDVSVVIILRILRALLDDPRPGRTPQRTRRSARSCSSVQATYPRARTEEAAIIAAPAKCTTAGDWPRARRGTP